VYDVYLGLFAYQVMNPSIGENVEKSIDSGGDVRAYGKTYYEYSAS